MFIKRKNVSMKKIIPTLILICCFASCSNGLTAEEIIAQQEALTNDIEIVFTTKEPNYDEAMITYYDIDLATDVSEPYVFNYDSNGDPTPIRLIFDNYEYDFLDGEVFRNNFSTSSLKVQVFIEGKLHLEEEKNGNANEFARINFSFRIP